MLDVVVVGGGHNGLVCAAYLARAGLSVTVVERRHVLGGAAVTEEVFPGFKYSVCSYAVSLLRPEIIRELSLARHGLTLLPLDGTFTPLHDGYLWRPEDPQAKHLRIAVEARHPTMGPFRTVRPPYSFDGEVDLDVLPPPTLDEHGDEIRAELERRQTD